VKNPGQTLKALLCSKVYEGTPDEGFNHKASIYPRDIRKLIEVGLERGWTPSEGKGGFRLAPDVDLEYYEVA
jgi:hypothetical protein